MDPGTRFTPVRDHAARWWAAEEENARRLGRRVNLQLTIIAAFLGLGAFRLLELRHGSVATLIGKVFVLLSLALLATAALFLLGAFRVNLRGKRPGGTANGGRERPLPATSELVLPEDALVFTGTRTREEAEHLAAVLTATAASRLYAMNLEEEDRIDRGQRMIIWGFGALFAAVMAFAAGGAAETRPSQVVVVQEGAKVYTSDTSATESIANQERPSVEPQPQPADSAPRQGVGGGGRGRGGSARSGDTVSPPAAGGARNGARLREPSGPVPGPVP